MCRLWRAGARFLTLVLCQLTVWEAGIFRACCHTFIVKPLLSSANAEEEVGKKGLVAVLLQSNVFYPYALLSSRICKCNKTIFIHEYRLSSDNFIFRPTKILSKAIKKENELFQANGSPLISAEIFCWQAQSRWHVRWNANRLQLISVLQNETDLDIRFLETGKWRNGRGELTLEACCGPLWWDRGFISTGGGGCCSLELMAQSQISCLLLLPTLPLSSCPLESSQKGWRGRDDGLNYAI